jgi:hypothetical protein
MVFIKFDLVKIQVRRDFVTPTNKYIFEEGKTEYYQLKKSKSKIKDSDSVFSFGKV